MHEFFKRCQPPMFDIYDGCNVTAKKANFSTDPKEFYWEGMKWMSEKTSCLKVVWCKQHFKQSVNVSHGNAYPESELSE